MLECADEVWDLLQHDAVVLVCGNAATIAPGVERLVDQDLPRPDGGGGARRRRLAGRAAARADRLVEDIWGG